MMTAVVIDDSGGRADWTVRAGTVWETDLELELAPGVPEDITSATITAGVFPSESSTTPSVSFTVTKPDPANGRARLRIPHTSATLAPGAYVWSSEIDTGNGPEPLLYGTFTVEAWNYA